MKKFELLKWILLIKWAESRDTKKVSFYKKYLTNIFSCVFQQHSFQVPERKGEQISRCEIAIYIKDKYFLLKVWNKVLLLPAKNENALISRK